MAQTLMNLIFNQKIRAVFLFWKAQWKQTGTETKTYSLLIRLSSVFFVYIVLDRGLMYLTNLPKEYFSETFIYFAFLKHLFITGYFIFLIPPVFLLFAFRERLICDWTKLPKGNLVRFVVVLPAGLLAWIFSTYDYNLLFDQAHYTDRVLLLVLLLLLYWKPIFAIPFLTALLPIIWQNSEIERYSWGVPYLPTRIIFLFSAFFLVHLVTKRFRLDDFVFLLGCLIATHYWVPGYGKLSWAWLRHDEIFYLLPSTYANGWLGFLSPETISDITARLSTFSLPAKVFTLLVECGGALFFLHRRFPLFFLIGWSLLHIGIAFISGIFFWVWILIECGLIFMFYKKDGFATLPVFSSKPHIIISVLLIITGSYWCRPARLAWSSPPMTYTYRFEAISESKQILKLAPVFFEPYGMRFTISNFGHLDKDKTLGIVWGASGRNLAQNLMMKSSNKEFFDYELSNGQVSYSERRTRELEDFLKVYVKNWNRRLSKDTWFSYFQPPRPILTYPSSRNLKTLEPIRQVNVYQITSVYRNRSYSEIRRKLVRQISITK